MGGGNRFGELGIAGAATGTDAFVGGAANQMGAGLPFLDITGVSRIHAGRLFTCAEMETAEVRCWGSNREGQLGRGENVQSIADAADAIVVDLGNNVNVTRLHVGSFFACALLSNDDLKCWGSNRGGALGLGLGQDENVGDAAGQMGENLNALQLGLNANENITFVSTGRNFACVATSDNRVKCWGMNQQTITNQQTGETITYQGMLGNGNTADITNAADASFVDLGSQDAEILQLSSGDFYTCVRFDAEAGMNLKCWGYNGDGELGLGDTQNRGDDQGEMGDNLPFLVL